MSGETSGTGSASRVPGIFSSPHYVARYLESGPAVGPLMTFHHGWPELSSMWRAQMDASAADGWRCVAPDLRDYGGSSW